MGVDEVREAQQRRFGEFVRARMKELGFSQNKVARRFGELPDGRGLDSTQVRLLKDGERRLDHALVERLIHVLELDKDPVMELRAWRAAGLWPEHLEPEDLGDVSERLAARALVAANRAALPEGAAASTSPSVSEHQDNTMATLLASARQRVAA